MAYLLPYQSNPEHYKRLILKINTEVDFPMCLYQSGYTLTNKSASSMEFQNNKDRIVLHIARNPVSYFNRNDSEDKGLFFNYLMLRTPNFYKAIEIGLEIINHTVELLGNTLTVTKIKKRLKSLEDNYHIVPLRKSSYLTDQRAISEATLNETSFKGRIFNAFHIRDNGGKIANIAFPKFDLKGTPRNYILYNKPYKSKIDNEIKKFRLVLNQKDRYLFYSNPVKGKSIRFVFGESGIDLLSYHELHGMPNNLYVSFGGNIYKEKLEFFVELFQKESAQKIVEVISITDNDTKGQEFDLKVFAALINHSNPEVFVESRFRSGSCSIHIHYREQYRSKIIEHSDALKKTLNSGLVKNPFTDPVKCIGFSDKIVVELNFEVVKNSAEIEKSKTVLVNLIETLNKLYLPFPTQVHKSKGKDWNEDLIASKSASYLLMEKLQFEHLSIGDKIKLKTVTGPEGSQNEGIVKEIKRSGVVCNFGLQYDYAIPFSAIDKHYKLKMKNTLKIKNAKSIKARKISNLKNNI